MSIMHFLVTNLHNSLSAGWGLSAL